MQSSTQSPPQADPGAARPNGAAAAPDSGAAPAHGAPGRRLSGSRRTAVIAGGALVALLVLIFGGRYLLYSLSHQGTDDAKIDADVVTITSKISERVAQIYVDTDQPVHKGELLMALDSRDEQSRYNQALAAYRAQLSQTQAADATVAYTRAQQSAQNQESEGTIVQARAGISSAQSQALSQQEQVSASQAQVDASLAQLKATQDSVPGALANLQKAQADYNRDAALVASGDVSRAQLDATRAQNAAAQSAYQQTIANVNAAQAQVAQSRQKLDAQRAVALSTSAQIGAQVGQLVTAQGHLAESDTPSRIAAQQAQAAAAKAQAGSAAAQLQIAADQLSYTKIYSAIDGYVGEKNVEVGQEVSPGLSLFTLVPSKNIYITANYKETQLGKMRAGQSADVHVDACPGMTLQAHVQSIAPASENVFSLVPAQNATANFVKVTQRVPVRIVFDNPDAACPLRPGMSVETYVNTKS
jgi:membrane fusion protein (multidrug efflux system)